MTVAELKQTVATLQADLAKATTKIAELEQANTGAERARKQAEDARLAAEDARHRVEEATSADKRELAVVHDAAATERRSWEILAYVLIAGVLALLIARPMTRWMRRTREAAPAKAGGEAAPSPGIPASADTFGRELDKHVADINATHGETPA